MKLGKRIGGVRKNTGPTANGTVTGIQGKLEPGSEVTITMRLSDQAIVCQNKTGEPTGRVQIGAPGFPQPAPCKGAGFDAVAAAGGTARVSVSLTIDHLEGLEQLIPVVAKD